MATEPSLFGATPESIQQARDAALNAQATSYANMDPFQRANFGIYRGANQLGGAVGRMLGGQDPEMEKASQMQQLASQASLSTPEGMMAYARKLQSEGFIEQAFAASQQAQQMQITGLEQTAKQQGVNATTASQAQQAAFREAVKTLGPNPTQAQLLSVASQFGDPKTLVASLQVSADKAERLAQQEREFILRQEENARLQRERLDAQGAQAAEARADRAANLQSSKLFAAALKGSPKLAPGLQKEEDKDLGKIDAGLAQQETFLKPLDSLRVDPATGQALLQLGPLNNQGYKLANARGQSTPASRAYEQYQAAFIEATNIKTDAANGIQTDSDVLRQANGIITAFGKNDNAASIQAIERFNEAITKSNGRLKARLENRRKSQNVESFYGVANTVFSSEAEATAANLPVGTTITINGRPAKVR